MCDKENQKFWLIISIFWVLTQCITTLGNNKAFNPNPLDGTVLEQTWAELSWSPGYNAIQHDVYIGNNLQDVQAGINNTFQGTHSSTRFIVGFPGFPYPDGLIPGTTYYWRVDEIEADRLTTHKGDVWSFMVPPWIAYNPYPADGAESVDPDVELSWTTGFGARLHFVYFGNDLNTVNTEIGRFPQAMTTFNPGPLELNKTYYWRVDEFDGRQTYRGDVWRFTTGEESPDMIDEDPIVVITTKTIYEITLDTDPAWIMDDNWQFGVPQGLGGTEDGNPDPVSGYTGDHVYGVNLSGDYDVVVGGPYYLTAGPFDCIGFSNVSLSYARWLNSDISEYVSNTVEVSVNGIDWTTIWESTEAEQITDNEWQTLQHDISHVADGQASVYVRWGYAIFYDTAYPYSGWNIDDIVLKGGTANIQGDFFVIDDFEDYNASDNQIWFAWHDGLGYGWIGSGSYFAGNRTGSVVGDEYTLSYTEETIVHGGSQSMPLAYDNNKQGCAKWSEVELVLDYPQDWTKEGVDVLAIWLRGESSNDTEPLYVAVSNNNGTSAVVVHDDPDVAQIDTWTEWIIPLQAFTDQGIDLTRIARIAIGLGTQGNMNNTPGGSGKMFFDDIRLYMRRLQ